MTDSTTRTRPNILVTGTPCVGKTAMASLIAERLQMYHVNVGEVIQQHKCHLEYDETLQTHVLDEDKLLDILEVKFDGASDEDNDCDNDNDDDGDCSLDEDDIHVRNKNQHQHPKGGIKGNLVADYHACELFPERWFDLILVLRADTHVLYDRLVQRGYGDTKRTQNMDCEIMNVVLDEAKESYAKEIVVELKSNSVVDMDQNVDRVVSWYRQWIVDHANNNAGGAGGANVNTNVVSTSS
eukprot:CAMPEP_0203656558 /NCGR_PEP_ID=MMETSP0088-20131115/41972_1 /ASSEMBLY_ACC=CAM_ASM_001087 /TAXON_ID=426623 /ORGANISM="Chaetoceros affinis, Strain CCMP159" /LENGTH=239 /DNA_ID=CAMNT_0050517589 /DNA_START=75 /DNA_END=794 /DNA_ORIENTATION=+